MSKKKIAAPTPAFASVEENCRFYSSARSELRTVMKKMQDEIVVVGEKFREELQAAIDQAVNARELLASTVERESALFASPRTRQFHGVKVGYQKLPDRLEFGEDVEVIALIREHLPDLEQTLVRSVESLRVDALDGLTDEQKKVLGVSRKDGKDKLVLKAADTDLDKLIKSLSGDASMTEDMVTKAGAI